MRKNEDALCVLIQGDFQDTLNEKSKVQMLLFVGGKTKQRTHTCTHTHTCTCVFAKNVGGKVHKDQVAVSASGDRGSRGVREISLFTVAFGL